MKIAMIGQKGIPTLFGGVERHVEGLSCNLAKKKDCQVFVYARRYYTPPKTKKYKKVNIIHLPTIRTKHLDAISHVFLSTWHAILILRPEIIHYHGIGPAILLWLPKIFSPKTKVVFTFHCRDYFHKKWNKVAQYFLKAGEIIGCYFADEVIAVSEEIQQYIKKEYNVDSSFISHGVGRGKKLPAKLIKKWGLNKDNYILAVNRLVAHKGIHYLIEAYSRIKTDKKLVIVGCSFYTDAYEQKIRSAAENNPGVVFLGAQKGRVLNELYSNAYLFVNPSEQEGLPMAVLEAGSFGCLLLLSDIPIHRKMFSDILFFFRNSDSEDLKSNLERILKNGRLLQSKKDKATRYSHRNYNWEEIVERVVSKYA